MKNNLTKKLPNGLVLTAELNNDPAYPGIQISLRGTGPVSIYKKKFRGGSICRRQ